MAEEREEPVGRFHDRMRLLREERLIEAARRIVISKGCAELSMDQVAAMTGVAKGTCYQHFDSRDALVDAAVHSLDESLAMRLRTPPAGLGHPRQVLEWACVEAVKAQIVAFQQRAAQAEPSPETLDGPAWPCCYARLPCPHGGAERSSEAIRHLTTGLESNDHERAAVYVALLLSIAPCHFFGLGSDNEPNPAAIRSDARHAFRRLFPE